MILDYIRLKINAIRGQFARFFNFFQNRKVNTVQRDETISSKSKDGRGEILEIKVDPKVEAADAVKVEVAEEVKVEAAEEVKAEAAEDETRVVAEIVEDKVVASVKIEKLPIIVPNKNIEVERPQEWLGKEEIKKRVEEIKELAGGPFSEEEEMHHTTGDKSTHNTKAEDSFIMQITGSAEKKVTNDKALQVKQMIPVRKSPTINHGKMMKQIYRRRYHQICHQVNTIERPINMKPSLAIESRKSDEQNLSLQVINIIRGSLNGLKRPVKTAVTNEQPSRISSDSSSVADKGAAKLVQTENKRNHDNKGEMSFVNQRIGNPSKVLVGFNKLSMLKVQGQPAANALVQTSTSRNISSRCETLVKPNKVNISRSQKQASPLVQPYRGVTLPRGIPATSGLVKSGFLVGIARHIR